MSAFSHGYRFPLGLLLFTLFLWVSSFPKLSAQDWLTPLELEKLRETEGGDKRIAFFMKAVKLRMDAVTERLHGKSTKPGDPLEFFSLTDLVSGCFQALRASMTDIQDQIQYKHLRGPELTNGLKALKTGAKVLQPFFQFMQKTAQEKEEPQLYKVAKEGLEYADSAIRGVDKAMKKYGTSEPYLPKAP